MRILGEFDGLPTLHQRRTVPLCHDSLGIMMIHGLILALELGSRQNNGDFRH